MQAAFGFFGTAIAAVVTLVSAAVGVMVFIVLWKSGVLPTLAEGFLIALKGIFVDVPVAIFNFLRDLLSFAAK
jgi:hypothetical protein